MRPLHTFFYTLALYTALLWTWPIWLLYMLLSPKVRTGFRQKLGCYPDVFLADLAKLSTQKPIIWLHAVSVGELNAVRPLIQQLLEQSIQVVVSTTTATGQRLASQTLNQPHKVPVFYCPLDLPWVLQKTLLRVNPDLVLVVETELWPNLTDQVTRWWKKPLLLINGRLSERSFASYRWVRAFIQPMLQQITACYMQDADSAERLKRLGAPANRVEVMGNLKFDIPREQPVEQTKQLLALFGFSPQQHYVLTFASTHAGEDELFAEVFIQLRKTIPNLRMVLAPRHPERCEQVRKSLNHRALRYSLRTELSEDHPNQQPIVILNTIGELQAVYGLSDVAIVGGSFLPIGGHNPLEPLAAGVPVVFGPHMFHFPEITRLLLEAKAAVQVENQEGLQNQLISLLTQPEKMQVMADSGQALLDKHSGVTEQLVQKISQLLLPSGASAAEPSLTVPL